VFGETGQKGQASPKSRHGSPVQQIQEFSPVFIFSGQRLTFEPPASTGPNRRFDCLLPLLTPDSHPATTAGTAPFFSSAVPEGLRTLSSTHGQ
jgi:hypothetical protein